ncbi:type II secretion system protein [Demequina sp. SYSU T00039]|uniref:Type II secretion system protein n=1 Tax=Demequina lignilytica TaxID=3051663 RepID=A0AAW7M728_9MICO|nr:type II secretion system protein [Demequina sp. SYSU T00039]MDN4486710.1 type II secretion system protein [Demequina sp. SYSU T00039]
MDRHQSDEGFGLVEVMVAMIVLAIIMVSMLSVILAGLRATANAATYATANELVQQRLEEARGIAASTDTDKCTSLASSITTSGPAVNDGRGVPIVVTGSYTGTCDSAVDSIVVVTMRATTTNGSFNSPMAETTTNIYVKGAS